MVTICDLRYLSAIGHPYEYDANDKSYHHQIHGDLRVDAIRVTADHACGRCASKDHHVEHGKHGCTLFVVHGIGYHRLDERVCNDGANGCEYGAYDSPGKVAFGHDGKDKIG